MEKYIFGVLLIAMGYIIGQLMTKAVATRVTGTAW